MGDSVPEHAWPNSLTDTRPRIERPQNRPIITTGHFMTSKGDYRTWTVKQASLIGIAILLLAGFCFGRVAVSLSPKDGPPTTTLRVSGTGFTPYAQIDIYFDSQDQALAVADAAGAFSQIAIQAPKSAVPGNHWVSAVERSGHRAKQEIFEVHVDWTDFHTKDMRRWNPFENVLTVNNVASLRLIGHYRTGVTRLTYAHRCGRSCCRPAREHSCAGRIRPAG